MSSAAYVPFILKRDVRDGAPGADARRKAYLEPAAWTLRLEYSHGDGVDLLRCPCDCRPAATGNNTAAKEKDGPGAAADDGLMRADIKFEWRGGDKAQVDALLEWFGLLKLDPRARLVFPASLTSDQRGAFHRRCEHFGLGASSSGFGEDRFAPVGSKPCSLLKRLGRRPLRLREAAIEGGSSQRTFAIEGGSSQLTCAPPASTPELFISDATSPSRRSYNSLVLYILCTDTVHAGTWSCMERRTGRAPSAAARRPPLPRPAPTACTAVASRSALRRTIQSFATTRATP